MRWALFATAFLMATPAAAQDTQLPAEVIQADMEAATTALNRMSAKLRTFDKFEVNVDAITEEVFLGGEKLQFLNKVRYVVDKPDNLYASVRSDRKWRKYFYDGQKVTVTAPASGYYASTPASGTINQLLDKLSNEYGIEVPLRDLFLWGTDGGDPVQITEAFLVGYALVGNVMTDQYFYRAPGVDFQLWIGREDDLPHRLVITNTEDEAQPTYTANLTWNVAPQFAANQFTFVPDENSSEIVLRPDPEEVGGTSQGGQP